MGDAISPEMCFNPDLAETIDQRDSLRGDVPPMPTTVECQCWLLSQHEGKDQGEIADALGITQSAVSKAIARGVAKIAALVDGHWIDRDRLEARIRRAVGLAPRT